MPGYSKDELAKLKKKGEWYTVKVLEEYRYWNRKRPWDKEFFRKHNLNIIAFSAKPSEITGENNMRTFTKKAPMRLKCGINVTSGRMGVTTQSRVASLNNVRVDDVFELNQVMDDASELTGLDFWEISKLEIHNYKLGPIITFSLFNPDGTGTALYLETVENGDAKRTYFDVPPYEQQKLCDHIQEKIANCVLVNRLVPKCGLQEYIKNKRAAIKQ